MALLLDHDTFLEHDPGTHVENPDRLRAIRRVLDETGLLDAVDTLEPQPASSDQLTAVHTPEHVDYVRGLSEDGGGRVDGDTVASSATYDAARLGSGAAVQAASSAISGEPAFSIARPPGHHATPDTAMGFCFFNHVAVAAQWALDEGGCERVAVFDHDVHHGNGTQDIFYEREDVLYVSIHQSPLFPGTGYLEETGSGPGEGYTVNLPVWANTGEAGMRDLLDQVALPVLDRYDADLLLVSAGYDSHHRDPLGNLHLSSAFYPALMRDLLALDVPIACILEGGYDPQGLARGVAGALALLAGEKVPRWDEIVPEGESVEHQLPRFREAHGL